MDGIEPLEMAAAMLSAVGFQFGMDGASMPLG